MILSQVTSLDGRVDEIEASLSRVKRKCRELWSSKFVRDKVRRGDAGLFEFMQDGRRVALMVVERYDQGDAPWMNVWILEGSPGIERTADMVALIDGLARSIGAGVWRFTGRIGWSRVLRRYAKPVAVAYERKLS
jgi:hypothetical protein